MAPCSVTVLPGGRAWAEGQAIITRDNYLLEDLSRTIGETEDYVTDLKRHPIFSEARLAPPRRLTGTAAVLSAPGGGGYYHWMLDVLPRLDLLRRSGMQRNAIDHFLVNSISAGYQRETLDVFEIEASKVIETRWNPHIEAERLVFPSLPGAFGHVPRWACDFLRSTFLSDGAGNDQPGRDEPRNDELLYLNRSRVTHRHVTNEPELIQRLESRGYTNVSLDGLSVREQALRLSRARVVVAPHGAGLTNIVFCRPGTRIVELLSPRDMSHVYWTLAETMALDYTYVMGEGPMPPVGVDLHDGAADISISVEAVEIALDTVAGSNLAAGSSRPHGPETIPEQDPTSSFA